MGEVSVDPNAMPWEFTDGINSAYTFGFNNGVAPTVVTGLNAGDSVTVTYVSGTVNVGYLIGQVDQNGNNDAGGGAWVTGASQHWQTGGSFFPTKYMPGSTLGCGGLCGCFADSSGNVIAALSIGNGPITFVVPTGATQIQLGINDDNYTTTEAFPAVSNSGGFVIDVTVTSAPAPATVVPPSGTWELWEILKPDIVQILPIARRFDQLGPEELFRYGKIDAFEYRVLPFGTTIPFEIFFNDNTSYSSSITVTNGKEQSYHIGVPKGTAGAIVRIEFGPTTFDFHRFYIRILCSLSGKDTELNWIALPREDQQ